MYVLAYFLAVVTALLGIASAVVGVFEEEGHLIAVGVLLLGAAFVFAVLTFAARPRKAE